MLQIKNSFNNQKVNTAQYTIGRDHSMNEAQGELNREFT
jgi:hypothetical protein